MKNINYKYIIVMTKPEYLSSAKKIIKDYYKEPHWNIKHVQVGSLGDNSVISCQVNEDQYCNLIQKLVIRHRLKLFAFNKETKDILETIESKQIELSNEYNANRKHVARFSDEQSHYNIRQKHNEKIKSISTDKVALWCKDGEYSELINIIKNHINYDVTIVNKCKELIIPTIKNAIEKLTNNGKTLKFELRESIDKLLSIASNEYVKSLVVQQGNDLQYQAGKSAIDLCCASTEVERLINISNSSALKPVINMYAFTKFAQIVLNTENKQGDYADELQYAIKNLNVRYIETIYDVVKTLLNTVEDTLYNELLNYIKTSKK